jgi:hypothetical protein
MKREAMRIALSGSLCALLCACGGPPMPAPAAGDASKQDSMQPADVTAKEMATPGSVSPQALPPPEMGPAEPVANDLGTAIADGWVGTWRGPEGTSLQIAKQEVGYQVTVRNLDGPREFHGVAVEDLLQFERDGVTETLRAGDGQDTGMKWLAGKHDCLVVKPGEGFCRD